MSADAAVVAQLQRLREVQAALDRLRRMAELRERAAFLRGRIAATIDYATWNDGRQYVGAMRRPLEQALQQERTELTNIERMLEGG